MKNTSLILALVFTGSAIVFAPPVLADVFINDDLIVTFDTCVGSDCIDGEVFDFDGFKIKTNDPQIRFDDTSSSASFPSNDWSVGITDYSLGGSADFIIKDATSDINVLVLQPAASGGVALGAGSTLEAGAISVGAAAAERPVKHVAAGVDATDAINLSQFNAGMATLDARMDDIEARIDDLLERINRL